MQTLAERFARFTSMRWEEVRTRASQETSKRLDLVRYLFGWPFEPEERKRKVPSAKEPSFFFSPCDIPRIAVALRKHVPDQCALIIADAERICRKEFYLLGFQKLNFGDRVAWHFDPVHGKCAPRRIWYKVPYQDTAQVGDAKVIWELNRHQHLVTLAKAHCLTGENRFAQEIFDEWENWQRENPYPLGINWASSLELGFRSLSWLWVWHLLKSSAAGADAFKERLWRSLAVHGHHIEVYLSTYSSPNTHLLGEGVALFFLGVLCPELHRAAAWKEKGWRIILEESKRQVFADGMHFEQSTYYHVYALDFFLHARILAERNGVEIPAEFDDILKRMLEWLSVVGQCRAIPRFGDDDGGRVFDGRRNRGEHLLDPLATGAVLFRRADWKAVAGGLREETLWLLGPNAFSEYQKLKCADVRVRSLSLENSGVYVMAEEGEIRQQLTIDAGRQGAFSSGHGHADALAVHFSINGREWLVDPGTFSYMPGIDNREGFRGTVAHNTLLVDGQSQAVPVGPFSWKALPQVEAESWVSTETFEFFEGRHTGYGRLPRPVMHRRSVFHLRPDLWFFHDWALGEGTHLLEILWHFSPEITLKKRVANACVFADPENMHLVFLTAESVEGSQRVDQGSYSPAYGSKVPALVLRYSQTVALPSAMATLIIPSSGKLEEWGKFERVEEESAGSGSCSYRYSLKGEIHQWVFARGDAPWRVGRLASDARLLYCSFLQDGQLERFVLSGGSFFRLDQRLLFEARETVPAYEWEHKSADVQR